MRSINSPAPTTSFHLDAHISPLHATLKATKKSASEDKKRLATANKAKAAQGAADRLDELS